MHDEICLIGKQPILNGMEDLTAFELLFRTPVISPAKLESDVQTDSRVILDTLTAIGIEEFLGHYQGFINVDRNLLMSDAIELLPQHMVGLELPQSMEITPEVVGRCRDLTSRGYHLALNDHEYCPMYEPLYNGMVGIIKINLLNTPKDRLEDIVKQFKRYPVMLLAKKVDTRDVFLFCRSQGFELFQGYYFAHPTLIQKQRLTSSIQSFLKLMQHLINDAEISEIEATFKGCPALVYKLLTLVNSVSYGLHEKILSIRQAINLIGRQHLKRWVQIALFAEDGRQELHSPIMYMAVARATFMEELARTQPHFVGCLPDEAFMVGILSSLKDIYEISVDEMVKGLNLSDNIQNALNENGSDTSMLLSLAKMIERTELDEAAELVSKLGIPFMSVLKCQKRSF
jgi:c-di-GMP-related signal transduction protein